MACERTLTFLFPLPSFPLSPPFFSVRARKLAFVKIYWLTHYYLEVHHGRTAFLSCIGRGTRGGHGYVGPVATEWDADPSPEP